MTLQDVVEIVETLSRKEQAELMHILVDKIAENGDKSEHHLLDFGGVGAALYDGTDAQEHINQLRDEWDEHE